LGEGPHLQQGEPMRDPDYVVIRDPEEPRISGTWYDLTAVLPGRRSGNAISYAPTPFIEVRDDGAVAQVYMRKR
jgi:hypothetical protein